MKVILTQDVARIGKRFEITDVPDGHALNLLIPKGMAMPATPANRKQIEAQQQQVAADSAARADTFAAAAAALEGATLSVAVEANEQGGLFQALKPSDVVTAAAAVGAKLMPDQVQFAEPIKEVGTHTVTLSNGNETSTIEVTVTAA